MSVEEDKESESGTELEETEEEGGEEEEQSNPDLEEEDELFGNSGWSESWDPLGILGKDKADAQVLTTFTCMA